MRCGDNDRGYVIEHWDTLAETEVWEVLINDGSDHPTYTWDTDTTSNAEPQCELQYYYVTYSNDLTDDSAETAYGVQQFAWDEANWELSGTSTNHNSYFLTNSDTTR